MDGRIAEAGGKAGPGRRELDAAGALVTPGFVDVHTHYDGQATWDSELAPSCWHGVTTVVMGNCGVGFAPARPDAHHALIRMMEGVEDIPGAALAEGLTWDWESFPEYLDALEARPRAIDIAAQVPHCAVRAYAMGERGIANEPATGEDVGVMADIVREALEAGARGFTTTRTTAHLTADGDRVPGAFAEERELLGLADAVGAVGGRTIGWISDLDEEAYELDLLRRMAERANGRSWLTVVQRDERPDQWASVLGYLEEAASDGVALHAQVAARPVGLMLGLSASLHPVLDHARLSRDRASAAGRAGGDPAPARFPRAPARGAPQPPQPADAGRDRRLPQDVHARRPARLRTRARKLGARRGGAEGSATRANWCWTGCWSARDGSSSSSPS